jgi:MFS family permease
MTLIKVKEIVLVGRFIFGFAVGSFSVFVPGFINELSPTELKGSLGAST